VLSEATAQLEEVAAMGIWDAIGQGAFADVKRTRTGGKGFAGVCERAPDYLNPIMDALPGRG
jgi:beta-lysine 5,6-aminomutase alpha subunit